MYDSKQEGDLTRLMTSIAPAAAVMLHIQICLVHSTFMDEGGLLARTLLPSIEKVTGFKFLMEEDHFIASRFLASLALHIRDTESKVGAGFVLFAMLINPKELHGMFNQAENKVSLREALTVRRYPPSAINVVALFPEKFLWPELLHFYEGKSDEVITQTSSILAKVDLLTDPGSHIGSLVAVLHQRTKLSMLLANVANIRLNLPRLISILEKLAPL